MRKEVEGRGGGEGRGEEGRGTWIGGGMKNKNISTILSKLGQGL